MRERPDQLDLSAQHDGTVTAPREWIRAELFLFQSEEFDWSDAGRPPRRHSRPKHRHSRPKHRHVPLKKQTSWVHGCVELCSKCWLRPKVLNMRVIFCLIICFAKFLFQVCFFIRCSDNEAFFLEESYGPSLSGPVEPRVPISNYSPIHKRILCSTALLYTYTILLCIRKSRGLSIPL